MIYDLEYWIQGFQAGNAQNACFSVYLQCTKVRFNVTDGIMQNSVLRISFRYGTHAAGPWILEMDEFHMFLAKCLYLAGSLDE